MLCRNQVMTFLVSVLLIKALIGLEICICTISAMGHDLFFVSARVTALFLYGIISAVVLLQDRVPLSNASDL